MEDSWWERLTLEETGSCSDGRAVLSKSLIQFSVEGLGCVPSLLFGLKPNSGKGNQCNGYLLQKDLCTRWCIQRPRPCSRPLLIHASTRDPWTLTGKSSSVSCGNTAPFSWLLVCTRFCLCPPRVCFHFHRKATPKNVQTITHWHSPHTLANVQNPPSKVSTVYESRTSRCSSWI